MGRTQRKTNQYVLLYQKKFKVKARAVASILKDTDGERELCEWFRKIYPHDYHSMEKHYFFYEDKNKRRIKGKPLFFPNPRILISRVANFVDRPHSSLNETERNSKITQLINESNLEQKRKIIKYRKNNISTQYVLPPYIKIFVAKYWREPDLFKKLYIVKEVAKYKTDGTIIFLRKVLNGEKDWFIRNTAFRTLELFDEVVYLPPKGKGKREPYNKLLIHFGCDYIGDIGKGPEDIMKEITEDNYTQTDKQFDVFISHAVVNEDAVDNLVSALNKTGMVAFVDWKSDKDDLNRTKANAYTADVLCQRMLQAKSLILIKTKESESSIWVAWELGYFKALGRKMAVLDIYSSGNSPEFIRDLPLAIIENGNLFIEDSGQKYPFDKWIGE